jgi:DNA-binding LytR/AlgR family response regulator
MNPDRHSANNTLLNILNPGKKVQPIVINSKDAIAVSSQLIRFEEKKEGYIWAYPDEIIFVISADHYVKSLINCGKQKKWVIRHCTLKDIFASLSPDNFIRLNKFYLINRNYFSCINEDKKVIYLNDNFPIPVPHRISRYVLDLLKK